MKKIKCKKADSLAVFEAFERFLQERQASGLTDKTVESYRNSFNSISLRMDLTKPITDLCKDDLQMMILRMREDNLSPTTINTYTRALKTFLLWCNDEGYSDLDIKVYKAPETVKETYSDEELMKLIKRPSKDCSFCEYRNWTIINFLINSGCRASTVRNIQNRDVDLEHGIVVFRHNKNGRVQSIPLCHEMIYILTDYMKIRGGEDDDYLFCNEYGDFLTENALRLAIEKYNKKRGVSKTSIHAFRHTFARKYLIDCGGNAFILQKLLSHSTLKMTKHYCNIYNSDVIKEFDKISPLSLLAQNQKKRIKK